MVLAEDNALLREGISRIIDGEPDFDLVGRASDLPELLQLIEDSVPPGRRDRYPHAPNRNR